MIAVSVNFVSIDLSVFGMSDNSMFAQSGLYFVSECVAALSAILVGVYIHKNPGSVPELRNCKKV